MKQIWFEGKVRFTKTMENGMEKKVTESYLVDALSFTEAEERLIKEVEPFISGEFFVSGIKIAKLTEIFQSEDESADRWYKCKLWFVTVDEKNGLEKKTGAYILVQAADLREAVRRLDEGMKGTMTDYLIASITETSIMDIFPYTEEGGRRDEG